MKRTITPSRLTRPNNHVTLKWLASRMAPRPVRRGLLALRDLALNSSIYYRKMAGWRGKLPDFIIIGAQKGGTTNLYDMLTRHPCVAPALVKEIHFFDDNFAKGMAWYEASFPRCPLDGGNDSKHLITGEASPSYLFHPYAARRIFTVTPAVKIIALLRNPVNRAYSHYHHEVRLGFEKLPFAEAIQMESKRLSGEKEKLLADETYASANYMHFSYLARGIYVDQIRAWRSVFPEGQILILKSEDFFRDAAAVVRQVWAFLGLPDWEPEMLETSNAFPYPKMEDEMKKSLLAYFEPHNQRLYEFSGVDFGWNR